MDMRIEKIPLFLVFALILAAAPVRAADDTYSVDEITAKATGFFGDTTAGLAKALEKVFVHGVLLPVLGKIADDAAACKRQRE